MLVDLLLASSKLVMCPSNFFYDNQTLTLFVKVSGTSLYLKIKFENEVTVKQEFQVRDLLLTR